MVSSFINLELKKTLGYNLVNDLIFLLGSYTSGFNIMKPLLLLLINVRNKLVCLRLYAFLG